MSPDGAWLASAGDDRTIHLWDLLNRRCAAPLKLAAPVHSVRWVPWRGPALAAASVRGLYVLRCGVRGIE